MRIQQFGTICTGILLLSLIWACGSGMGAVSEAQREEVRQLVDSRQFEFTGDWAMPLSGNDMNQIYNARLLPPGDSPNRINLIGNYNFLKVSNDSVSAYLPFFGRQQFNVRLNAQDQAIQFEEQVNDLQVTHNEDKDRYDIRFTASRGTHGYVLFLTILPNASATLRISSSTRDNISYQGTIKPLVKKEQ